ncbi:MAG: hypothetical protein ACRCV4_16420 [Hafnia alvei]
MRIASQGEPPAVEWYVSSAGSEFDGWAICRVNRAGQVTDLYYDVHFQPDTINALLVLEAQRFITEVAA